MPPFRDLVDLKGAQLQLKHSCPSALGAADAPPPHRDRDGARSFRDTNKEADAFQVAFLWRYQLQANAEEAYQNGHHRDQQGIEQSHCGTRHGCSRQRLSALIPP